MAKSVRIRAKLKKGVTVVKALIRHPMETGQRKDKKGKKIPAHFIQEVICKHNGNVVLTCLWGAAVSANPYISFKFKGGKKKDSIEISWVDNKGKKGDGDTRIK